MKWIRHLIPQSWRDDVVQDVEREAQQRGHGRVWVMAHTVAIAWRMRRTIARDAGMTEMRYLVNTLWRARGFAAVAMLTLTVGIGLNLIVFGTVDRALFRALPYAEVDRLLLVSPASATGGRYTAMPRALMLGVRDLKMFEDVAYSSAFPPTSFTVTGQAGPPLLMAGASHNLMALLGVGVVAGRGFTESDAAEKLPLALLSYETWQSRFGGSPAVIGQRIGSGARGRTIIGVLPPGFMRPAARHYAREDGVTLDAELFTGGPATANTSAFVVRMPVGMAEGDARRVIEGVSERLKAQLPAGAGGRWPRIVVEPLRAGMFAPFLAYLWLVVVAAAFVGLLTALNLAGLLLVRARSRVQEIAMRMALGAGRLRVCMMEAAQGFAICGLGGAVALAVTHAVIPFLTELVPANLRTLVVVGIDGRMVWLTVGLALLSGAIAGVVPAWLATRADLVSIVQSETGRLSQSGTARLGRCILVVETALGVVLLAVAAMVFRSYLGLATADLGYQTAGLFEVTVNASGVEPRDPRYEHARYLTVLAALRTAPGVASAAGGDSTPGGGAAAMSGGEWNGLASAGLWQVSDQWLETLGAHLVAGRSIEAADVRDARPVAVISRDLATRLWPGVPVAEVLGRALTGDRQPARRVVGVVEEMRDAPGRGAEPRVFVPPMPSELRHFEFIVRTRGDVDLDAERLRMALPPELNVTGLLVSPAGSVARTVLRQPRVQAIILAVFALVGVMVSGVGLYAVSAFNLAQRRFEFGIRAALGASAGRLRGAIVGSVLTPVSLGLLLGLGGALAAGELVASLVTGVDVHDPGTLGLVAAAMCASALMAAWLPARRASRIDPATVLRSV